MSDARTRSESSDVLCRVDTPTASPTTPPPPLPSPLPSPVPPSEKSSRPPIPRATLDSNVRRSAARTQRMTPSTADGGRATSGGKASSAKRSPSGCFSSALCTPRTPGANDVRYVFARSRPRRSSSGSREAVSLMRSRTTPTARACLTISSCARGQVNAQRGAAVGVGRAAQHAPGASCCSAVECSASMRSTRRRCAVTDAANSAAPA